MQRGFTKLFNTIVTSTIWQEPDATRIVWITMLALMDAQGIVSASLPGLASVANVTLEKCEEAIKALESPDPYSRTKEFDGRRIEPIDGGWRVLNAEKYRRMLSNEERREYQAKWARDRRAEKKGKASTNVDSVDTRRRTATSPSSSASSSGTNKKEDGRNPRPKSREEVVAYVVSIGLPESDGVAYWDKWVGNGFKNGGKAMADWRAVCRQHKAFGYFPSQKRRGVQSPPSRPSATDREFHEAKARRAQQ